MAAIPASKVIDETVYNKLPDIKKLIGDDGINRYYSGTYFSLDLARNALMSLKQKGFKDAFVVAYKNDKRITIKEAREILQQK